MEISGMVRSIWLPNQMLLKRKKSFVKSKSTKKKTYEPSSDGFPIKHVSIGPRFQAEVPQWTGDIFESDSKWLGTQV
jgi:hypothetical protein